MTWLNNSKSFGRLARVLHMAIGLVVISLLVVGLLFDKIPSGSPKIWAVSLHKLIGFCVLWFVLLWWIDFFRQKKPDVPQGFSKILHVVSVAVKLALLICATLMPLSGWLMGAARGHTDIKALGFALPNPFVVPYPEISKLLWEVHETTANILILAIGLHVAGALYHHFIRKDSVLVRMFPFIPARNRDNILS